MQYNVILNEVKNLKILRCAQDDNPKSLFSGQVSPGITRV